MSSTPSCILVLIFVFLVYLYNHASFLFAILPPRVYIDIHVQFPMVLIHSISNLACSLLECVFEHFLLAVLSQNLHHPPSVLLWCWGG